jgi:DHA1 family bicyclomycin/chloramphenicol resistance-like MFS transporter
VVEVMRNRRTVSFVLAGACCYGALMGYINASQQVFQNIYGVGDLYPVYFGACAAFIAAATLTNSVVVARIGMERISVLAIAGLTVWSTLFLGIAAVSGSVLPLGLWLPFTAVALFLLGLVFGNVNALALQPLGHIAGLASAVTASVSTVVSLAIAAIVGNLLDGTVMPVLAGYALSGAVGSALLAHGRRVPRHPAKTPV